MHLEWPVHIGGKYLFCGQLWFGRARGRRETKCRCGCQEDMDVCCRAEMLGGTVQRKSQFAKTLKKRLR